VARGRLLEFREIVSFHVSYTEEPLFGRRASGVAFLPMLGEQ